MNVIVIAGPPGSGKTWTRTNDPALKDLPYLDMDELRQSAARECGPGSSSYWIWRQSMLNLLDAIDTATWQGVENLVIEGVFSPGSKSFLQLEDKCRQISANMVYKPQYTTSINCAENIIRDYYADGDEERWLGRMDILIKVTRREND